MRDELEAILAEIEHLPLEQLAELAGRARALQSHGDSTTDTGVKTNGR